MTSSTTFFSLPAEIRNEIYGLLWPTEPVTAEPDRARQKELVNVRLAPLLVCRKIREEAELFALSRTRFQLGEVALPDAFCSQICVLSPGQIGAIRTLTLTARVKHLRALNEAWEGLPFGHPSLSLDRLIIVPQKPDVSGSCYAEVADLSQCHTLAYVLAETLKGLRHVRCVELQNHGCFKDLVWRLLYRCMVYRMWRWGGIRCGLTFLSSDISKDGSGEEWFKIWIGDETRGNEVGLEVCRLMGKDGMDPDIIS